MQIDATYSPDDNKIRLYPSARLDPETYGRVKAAGFKWAPAQKIFVAPMWTPAREDLALELAGEIRDEDKTLAERAEERAERFEEYSEKRADEADRAREAVGAIADNIPLGQPILVGHHSERRARRDAEKIESGMRRAVNLWKTSQYWQGRAHSAIAHAKYKELPAVRYRRIKGIEADKRKAEKDIAEAQKFLKAWSTPGLTWKQARGIANYDHISPCFTLAEFPRKHPNASTYEGATSLWSALGEAEGEGIIDAAKAAEIAIRAHSATIAWRERWIEHYTNRLAYENAMLGDQGGIAADKFNLEVGGRVLTRHNEWVTILRVNKTGGAISSVSTNARYVSVIPVESIRDYQAPTDEAKAAAKNVTKLAPLCNYPGADFVPITQADWDRKYKDGKSTRTIAAADGKARHRVRCGSFGNRGTWGSYVNVYITDAPTKYPADEKPEDAPPKLEAPTPDLAALQARAERAKAAQAKESNANGFEKMAEALKQGVKVVSANQLFPTPPAIARQLVELADIQPGQKILEPSAGTGNLIQAIYSKVQADWVILQAVEINGELVRTIQEYRQKVLYSNDYNFRIEQADFLEWYGTETYHRIVMNPPFENASDIKHVLRAYSLLKPGGKLAAIVANGPRQQEQLKPIASKWIDLPAGSFAASSTNVNTAMILLEQK